MINWSSITLLSVEQVVNIYSEKGKNSDMKNRPFYGLSFCREGRISYIRDEVCTVSDRMHAILLPKGQSYRIRRDETGEFPVINFTCTEDLGSEILSIPLKNPEAYLRNAEQMRQALLRGENRARLMSILYGILSDLSMENEEKSGEHFLAPSVEFLTAHLNDPTLSNRVLAEQIGVSEVYFRKRFRECYRQSPKQYVLDARIRMAKTLLSEKSSSVTAISEACGFSSVYHFCRAFRNHTGLTPGEYAKREGQRL